MEKKSNNCPVDACEKFFKSITVRLSSPFRPIRGISNHHPAPNPSAAAASNPIVKTHQHHTHKRPKFDYSAPQKNGKVASGVAQNKNMEPVSQFVQAKKMATKHNATRMESNNKMNASIEEDDQFTKYIKRAWNKIRTPSSVGTGGKNGKINASESASTGREDTAGKDHFSDYIDRAKKKMLRIMSSSAGGRN